MGKQLRAAAPARTGAEAAAPARATAAGGLAGRFGWLNGWFI